MSAPMVVTLAELFGMQDDEGEVAFVVLQFPDTGRFHVCLRFADSFATEKEADEAIPYEAIPYKANLLGHLMGVEVTRRTAQ